MTSKKAGTQFLHHFGPLLDALRALGGSATPDEATDKIAELSNISERQLNEALPSGGPRFKNQVAWARFYLKREGLLDSSKRGVWSLTEKGAKTHLTYADAHEIFKKQVQIDTARRKQKHKATDTDDAGTPEELDISASANYRTQLLDAILALPFEGFERLSQRLLREAGFQQVLVTGRSGDNGIDGEGILEVNPFVTFKVLFQCKRYRGSVGAPVIRDFRGAMLGRADKGIILTTGNFTQDARREARRDGAPPVELVDGDKLVEMFEKLELGLIPRITFDVDQKFFDEFRVR
ncbi:MAG: restriction endonuclease [Syntrophobacteraceae bacterium]|nr:restriction endonuclease [Syntrophobacteraceae bacterium]MCU0589720.1 restriction endonuclease [Syntrophobacteraceae bacterium]